MQLPQYTKNDKQIYFTSMPVVVLVINCMLFQARYFTEPKVFIISSLIIWTIMTLVWIGFTWLAVTIRNRLPSDKDLMQRIGITILIIAIIQALVITLFFKGYDYFDILGYQLNEPAYYWSLLIALILNIIVIFAHEGFESFEKWKVTLTETEQLKKIYTQSQLLSLKSQVNPHFLFNCLNTLSSLISEDEEKAEKFLNELTRIYRYLLRGNDEQFVKLGTELQFINSYYYLIKARYGDSIQMTIDVEDKYKEKLVTPLLLQTLFEYSFNTNMIAKEKPLRFHITTDSFGKLLLSNNIQPKHNAETVSTAGITNLSDKYRLLTGEEINIVNDGDLCKVRVPLLDEKSVSIV